MFIFLHTVYIILYIIVSVQYASRVRGLPQLLVKAVNEVLFIFFHTVYIVLYIIKFQLSFCESFSLSNSNFWFNFFYYRLALIHIWSLQQKIFFTNSGQGTIFDHFIIHILQSYNKKFSKMFFSKNVLETPLLSWSMVKILNFKVFLLVPSKGLKQ